MAPKPNWGIGSVKFLIYLGELRFTSHAIHKLAWDVKQQEVIIRSTSKSTWSP